MTASPQDAHRKAVEAGRSGDHDAAARALAGQTDTRLTAMRIRALEAAGRYADAIALAEGTAASGEPAALNRWLTVLLRYGQTEAGLRVADDLLSRPGLSAVQRASVQLQRGHALRTLGQPTEAAAAYRAAAQGAPGPHALAAESWAALADMKTQKFESAERDRIARLATDGALPPATRRPAAFALARALEVDGDPGTVDAFHAANTLYDGPAFDPARFMEGVERIIAAVTEDALRTRAPQPGAGTARPVFIVGLPRSGSTLVEQILGSHSAVEATQELPLLPAVKQRAHLHCARELGVSYLDGLGSLPADALAALGGFYREQSRVFRPSGAPVFTDKLPHNFEHVGLIAKILPDAVVVDVRRDPEDCAWSLYRHNFPVGVPFSYDLAHIGTYMRGYQKLMDHWDAVLPGLVHRVDYEALVDGPEAAIRKLCESARLAFEPAMLDFHQSRRAVRTASSEQVRQPLYRTSIGSARAAGLDLGRFRAALSS